ncbi:MAG: uncharacterized protein JWP19_1219 [Rhodoglobus sp.]|nr:uncharacterized protein [Rhodoglobus sp.]
MTDSQEQVAPLVALISGTSAAIAPATAGVKSAIPDAIIWNLLDDRLLVEADEIGEVDDRLRDRMARLIEHAKTEGAQGILLTCSMYGAVAHDLDDETVPVLAADDAAFAAVIDGGFGRVLFVASFESALADTVKRFGAAATEAGDHPIVLSTVPKGALAATKAGDLTALADALIEGCLPFVEKVDAVLLGQYSLAPAADALSAALRLPVLSGPGMAATVLRRRLETGK